MGKADLEKARELYPSCAMGMDDWLTFFRSSAGLAAMGKVIYDIYDESMSIEEREAGRRRIGRRPAREAVALLNVMAVVSPEEFSNEPLAQALAKLLRGRSQGQFATKVPISQPYLSRLLAGKRAPLTLDILQRLADAAGVQPWHFVEWRAIYLGELVEQTLRASPHLGITLIKDLRTRRRSAQTPSK